MSNESLLSIRGDKFLLGFELEESSFVQRLLYVEGHRRSLTLYEHADEEVDGTRFHLQDVEWYVGDSPDYTKNTKCH